MAWRAATLQSPSLASPPLHKRKSDSPHPALAAWPHAEIPKAYSTWSKSKRSKSASWHVHKTKQILNSLKSLIWISTSPINMWVLTNLCRKNWILWTSRHWIESRNCDHTTTRLTVTKICLRRSCRSRTTSARSQPIQVARCIRKSNN